MRTYFFPLLILFLFFASSIFLTVRQEVLFSEADQALVSIGYLEPANATNKSFYISHQAAVPRSVSLEYRFPNQEAITEAITLEPKEKRVLTAPESSTAITVRYQDTSDQEQVLTLYKK
jgi:hypothetical protein